ncbi:MAG TPA: hypothetical protein DCX25_04030 [Candidatus Pacebacteria bacterium]|nr:MAG: hypothetical protein UX00_C0006G0023 [Microgenomates group bacterium GW2011_GWB1_45_17]KKU23724.1 MAG: hypothetical protein UX36_C0003G0024 [Microgenomates group bacterium GW2011_GWC1_46_15]HAV15475.1 hypothetical protein [Candidatus Paceibacterota bacterium]HCR11282.1 hypothetical protein [Candidatus Paceibacterota bacterium]HCR92554.1 hypothetical protein [Candidatus Paceibacterota bacterium]
MPKHVQRQNRFYSPHAGWEQVADILSDIGQVFFATYVLTNSLKGDNLLIVEIGLFVCSACWITSIAIKSKMKGKIYAQF